MVLETGLVAESLSPGICCLLADNFACRLSMLEWVLNEEERSIDSLRSSYSSV